ncbi:lytic transglycosylase domain-containing protein [Parvimonas micra]|uniref:lytic transglycosylase domain-containing protein n=1 Tax=Parvimonas micra TaxID=33033 RepID=UPI0021CB8736|nr:transglycosylase SLT domain-containing protein [Parvimonas micra]
MPKGTSILPHGPSMQLLNKLGVKGYAGGIGDFFTGLWHKVKSGAKTAIDIFSDPSKLISYIKDKVGLSDFQNEYTGVLKYLAIGLPNELFKGIKNKLKDAFIVNPSGSGVQRWKPAVVRALAMNGLSTSAEMVNKVLRQIATESGGNPLAVQHGYTDINTITGDLAKGLMQTISATFNAYKFPGHGNIFNGFDNLLAALNYAKHRYGKTLSALGKGHGYAKGGLVTTEQIAKIGEGNKAEMVIPLTNKTRAIQLMMQALAILGGNSSSGATTGRNGAGTVDMTDTNNLLKQLINLVASIDPNVYLDGKKLYDNNKKYSNQEANIRNVFKGVMSIG